MRILVVGEGRADLHEVAVAEAFRRLGHDVSTFYWHRYFTSGWAVMDLASRFQNRLLMGPSVAALNRDFVAEAVRLAPDLIFVYRGTHIFPASLATIKGRLPHCRLFGYNNDDPFSPAHPRWMWRFFVNSLPIYDVAFAYRPRNVRDFQQAGARRVELLKPWFVEADAESEAAAPKTEYACDVVFVGHYENDSRLEYLQELCDQGVDFRLFGPDWNRAPKLPWLTKMGPIRAVGRSDYYSILRSARIALCFLSRLNRDTYTRRSFEIPAAGTFMLSEYTDDLAALFRPGVEADYFRNRQEMLAQISTYLADDDLRTRVAAAGRRRVTEEGHDIVSRARSVLALVQS